MVRLYTSLLTFALAAGSALAFSDEYQRRSEIDSNLYRRDFIDSLEMPFTREDHGDLYYGREVLDAREPLGVMLGMKLLGGVGKIFKRLKCNRASGQLQSRAFELDDGELFGRDIDAEELWERDIIDESLD